MTNQTPSFLDKSFTLFRFNTIRSPQKVSTTTLSGKSYIQHPAVSNSALFSATSEELQSKLANFNPANAQDLKSQYSAFYKVFEEVLQSRKWIGMEEYNSKILNLAALDSQTYFNIWDSFSYQVLTDHSVEDREIFGVFIYGQHLLNHPIALLADVGGAIPISNGDNNLIAQNPSPTTGSSADDAYYEEKFRELLDAKIVIPKEFISPENENLIQSVNQSIPPVFDLKENHEQRSSELAVKNADFQIGIFEKVLKSISVVETAYEKEANQKRKEFAESLEVSNEQAYNQYLLEIQSHNGEPNYQAPMFQAPRLVDSFDYEGLKANKLNTLLSEEEVKALDALDLDTTQTFDEIKSRIEDELHSLYSVKIQNIPTDKNVLVLDGTAIEPPSFNFLEGDAKFIGCSGYTVGIFGGYKTDLECMNFEFNNSNEYVTALSYSGGGNLNFQTATKSTNGFVFSIERALYSNSITFNIRVTTNLGNIYTGSITLSENSCFYGDLFLDSTGNSGDSDNPVKGITRLGIMDYRKVEQYICCYVPGEVSHIENIMAREYKSRTTRRLRRSENTTTINVESEREKLTDTASTEKNEMQEELSKLVQETKDFQINAGVKWEGPVSGHVDGSFAYHTSKEESNKLAKSMAKELTMKATERILEKTREERIQKIVEEFSDENQHGVDNRQGDKHISGVYRWVDKVYKNVIHNYGKRLLFEFMIPEPASFHSAFLNSNKPAISVVSVPTSPSAYGVYNASNINPNNYILLASEFNSELAKLPEETISITKSYSGTSTGGASKFDFNDIVIPEGYRLKKTLCKFDFRKPNASSNDSINAVVTIGNKLKTFWPTGDKWNGLWSSEQSFVFDYYNEEKANFENLAVGLTSFNIGSFVLNVTAVFERTDSIYKDWQIKSYNKIMASYNERYKAYEEKLAELTRNKPEEKQTNSLFYREIEQTTLRKNCIAYLLKDGFKDGSFVSGNDLKSHSIAQTQELENYAAKVKFLEQAFEWEIMGYQFYPFYWADSNKWNDLVGQETSDKLFTKFLQSGMARVFLTVRPGFEEAVNWYMSTGKVWMGSQPPVVGDELFLSILDELKNPESVVEGEWESRVPSTLTVIQSDSIGLNASGLPCMDVCKDHNSWGFEQDTTTLKNLTVKVD